MADFEIKEGDRLPELAGTAYKENGSVQDLTGFTGVTFSMRKKDGVLKVDNQAGTIVSASAGTVKYAWAAADTDTPGFYFGEFKATFSDGRTLRIPNNGHIEIVVKSKVN